MFSYVIAIVRRIPSSFSECISLEKPSVPIDVVLARIQHQNYVSSLEKEGLRVEEIEAEEW